MRRVLRPGGLYVFVEHVAAKGVNKTLKFTNSMLKLKPIILVNSLILGVFFCVFMHYTDGTFLKFMQRVLDPLR